MIWKIIGQSVIGSSHIQSGKGCEDAIQYETVTLADGDEALICFISDGAGSAQFAQEAAKASVAMATELAADLLADEKEPTDQHLLQIAEQVYDHLNEQANIAGVPKNEFSCTLLGFILLPKKAAFLQIGDGAIIRNDGSGHFTHIFWPHNGEYQNTTAFLIDNPNLPDLRTKIVDEAISEISIFTDGLQMLTLNHETETVHQPFFTDLFKWLRMAREEAHTSALNIKLTDYLSGPVINSRTDDDKTLLLATRNS